MNLEQLKELIHGIGDDTLCEMTGETGLAPEEKQKIDEAIEGLREVAQAALEFMPEGNSIIEVVEARNDLIDAFNLSYDL